MTCVIAFETPDFHLAPQECKHPFENYLLARTPKKLTTQLLRLSPQQPTLKNPSSQPVPFQTALQTLNRAFSCLARSS
jgi:hypothetical protein